MDDDRQSGSPRRCDVSTKSALLRFPPGVLIIEIEARLAESNDLRMRRQLDETIGQRPEIGFGFVRMDSNGATDIVMSFGDRDHGLRFMELGADRQKETDFGRPSPEQYALEIAFQRGEIQMTMAIDPFALRHELGLQIYAPLT